MRKKKHLSKVVSWKLIYIRFPHLILMSLEGKHGRGNRRGGVRGGGGGGEYCIAERRRENDKIKIIFFSY